MRLATEKTLVDIRFAPQQGPQTAFIHSPVDVTTYGGARGGGKTHGSLGDFWIHAERYRIQARGLMLRKTREDLKDTIAVGVIMYGSAAHYIEKGNYFQFRNGARLYCAYLENEADAQHYQGWSLTRVYIEELTQFHTADPVLILLATLRSAAGVPCRMKCTCNPGGPGHHWVKRMFIDHGAFNVVEHEDTGIFKVFIPAKLTDNPALLEADPGYVNRLKAVGSPQLVKAWMDGDWSIVEGAFFPEFAESRHVIAPFTVPPLWLRFRSMDWGSARPFSVGWWTVVQDDMQHDGRLLPRGSIVRYREWYGCQEGKTDTGLKMPAETVAKGIVSRETDERGNREHVTYGVLDPAAFAVISGPSIGETLGRNGAHFRRADNTRVSRMKRMGGFDQIRQRLNGDSDGRPMVYFFSTCKALIRTLPIMQHDEHNAEDMDTDTEDHAVDDLRYACMSRPYLARITKAEEKSPYMVKNAFKFDQL
jgi:Terminase large subunit, T4likevirus-type, N-terminal